MNVKEVLNAEIAGSYAKYVDNKVQEYVGREWDSMLVAGTTPLSVAVAILSNLTVSSTDELRDVMRDQVRQSTNTNRRIWFTELEYQPSRSPSLWDSVHRRINKPLHTVRESSVPSS